MLKTENKGDSMDVLKASDAREREMKDADGKSYDVYLVSVSEIDRCMCLEPPEFEFTVVSSCACKVISLRAWKLSHRRSEPVDLWKDYDLDILLGYLKKRRGWKTLTLPKKR